MEHPNVESLLLICTGILLLCNVSVAIISITDWQQTAHVTGIWTLSLMTSFPVLKYVTALDLIFFMLNQGCSFVLVYFQWFFYIFQSKQNT